MSRERADQLASRIDVVRDELNLIAAIVTTYPGGGIPAQELRQAGGLMFSARGEIEGMVPDRWRCALGHEMVRPFVVLGLSADWLGDDCPHRDREDGSYCGAPMNRVPAEVSTMDVASSDLRSKDSHA